MHDSSVPQLSVDEAKHRLREAWQQTSPIALLRTATRAHPLRNTGIALLSGALAQMSAPVVVRVLRRHPELLVLMARILFRLKKTA